MCTDVIFSPIWNNELLWEALIDGTLDFIGSDHSPAPPSIKELDSGNLLKAWGGISGIQFTLPALWTKGQDFGLSIRRLYEILCVAPAKFIGLEHSKGKIEVGFDADFVVWDPKADFLISNDSIEAKHKVSPYEGLRLKGRVNYTWVDGNLIWNNRGLVNKRKGKLIINF